MVWWGDVEVGMVGDVEEGRGWGWGMWLGWQVCGRIGYGYGRGAG